MIKSPQSWLLAVRARQDHERSKVKRSCLESLSPPLLRLVKGLAVPARASGFTLQPTQATTPERKAWHQSLTNCFFEVIHNFLKRQGFCACVRMLCWLRFERFEW